MKLKEWAEKTGIKYLTAYRWYKAGDIPGAYQTPSGTILIPDEEIEQNMASNSPNDAMSLFLKKTVEYSKNNSSVEDFAAYVISNFTIKLNNATEPSPKYSKNRPKPEEVQKHFQKFLPDKEKQEHLKAIKNLIETKGAVEPLPDGIFNEPSPFSRNATSMDPEYEAMGQEILTAYAPQTMDHMYGSDTNTTEGLVNRSVDFDTTPQQVNYTGSNDQVFSSIGVTACAAGDLGNFGSNSVSLNSSVSYGVPTTSYAASPPTSYLAAQVSGMPGIYFSNNVMQNAAAFQPTQKELLSAVQVIETAETEDAPRGKRGRKPSKKR